MWATSDRRRMAPISAEAGRICANTGTVGRGAAESNDQQKLRTQTRRPRKQSLMQDSQQSARENVVVYARVSSKEQEREGFSIPAQLELLRTYAKQHGMIILQ